MHVGAHTKSQKGPKYREMHVKTRTHTHTFKRTRTRTHANDTRTHTHTYIHKHDAEHADFEGIENLALVLGGEISSTFDNTQVRRVCVVCVWWGGDVCVCMSVCVHLCHAAIAHVLPWLCLCVFAEEFIVILPLNGIVVV